MKLEELKSYFEERGYTVSINGTAPLRHFIFSKKNYSCEYYEEDWNDLPKEEQLEELEDVTSTVERILSKES